MACKRMGRANPAAEVSGQEVCNGRPWGHASLSLQYLTAACNKSVQCQLLLQEAPHLAAQPTPDQAEPASCRCTTE